MKRKTTKRPARDRNTTRRGPVPLQIKKMHAAVAKERQQTPHELVGRILAASQAIETQMKLYITNRDKSTKLANLEGQTFGQVLTIFKKHCQDRELLGWLGSMREARNDVAHTYFRNRALMTRQFGEAIAQLEHKRLTKIIRISEICHGLLGKLLKQRVRKTLVATAPTQSERPQRELRDAEEAADGGQI